MVIGIVDPKYKRTSVQIRIIVPELGYCHLVLLFILLSTPQHNGCADDAAIEFTASACHDFFLIPICVLGRQLDSWVLVVNYVTFKLIIEHMYGTRAD